MLRWLELYNIPPIFVVTKCDKLSKNEQARQKSIIAAAIKRDKGMMLPFSALSKEGRDGIWNEILHVLDIQLKPGSSASFGFAQDKQLTDRVRQATEICSLSGVVGDMHQDNHP